MSTISTTISNGITLGATYASPLTIAKGGEVLAGAPDQPAIYGTIAADTVVNFGGVVGGLSSGSGFGVQLKAGGAVTNQSGGMISGNAGVYIAGADGTVVNTGSIIASTATTSTDGVVLNDGGTVTNNKGGSIAGFYGVYLGHTAASLSNAGSIAGGSLSGSPGSGAGVFIGASGGTETNLKGGTISGYHAILANATTTIVNAGSVAGASAGVYLRGGSTLINQSGGTVSGYDAAFMISGGTVVNTGALEGNTTGSFGEGVDLSRGGAVTNQSGGTIAAHTGVYALGSATLTNAGLIAGGTGGRGVNFRLGGTVTNQAGGVISGVADAVAFASGQVNRVVIDPGATFVGIVDGGNVVGGTAVSTLELASGVNTGTLSGLGVRYFNFGAVTIDSAATWALTGSNALAAGGTITNAGTLSLSGAALTDSGDLVNGGVIQVGSGTMTAGSLVGSGSVTIGAGGTLEAAGTIAGTQTVAFGGSGAFLRLDLPTNVTGDVSGLGIGETIDLTGIAPGSVSLSGGTLSFLGGAFPLSFADGDKLLVSTSADGTAITAQLACFAEGTRIRTTTGLIPVEALREGMMLPTLVAGETAPIVWIGARKVDCANHPDPETVWPVRVGAGAFGPGLPCQGLLLSPDHAVYVNGGLVPVKLLINGATITQEKRASVTYYHVELPWHDVVLAEDLPAESYLDIGDRANFAGESVVRLVPDFSARHTGDAANLWETHGCATLVLAGRGLAEARRVVAGRAAPGQAAGSPPVIRPGGLPPMLSRKRAGHAPGGHPAGA